MFQIYHYLCRALKTIKLTQDSSFVVFNGSNKLGYDMCVDCMMMTPINSYATTRITIEE